jgi:DNA-binding IclR family transcriptional regulator
MAILECLDTSRRGLNISEVSRKLEMPKSSVHVLMVTLERLGYIRRAPNGRDFCLALKTYALGQKMARMVSVGEIALPHMEQLTRQIHLTTNLAVLDRDQGVFIQKTEPPNVIGFDTYVGRRMDLHCTSLGKVILAFSSAESTQHVFRKKKFARYTPKTITSAQELKKEITRVQELGYAVDNEEEELGARCVGVPVLHESKRFIAALSVAGTVAEIPVNYIEKVVADLRQTAAAIAAEKIPLPPMWY